MKATIKNIQDHIDAKYPEFEVTFYKGNGYFYFMGDTYLSQNIDSIYMPHLNCAPFEWWIESVESSIDEAIAREA